MSRDVENCGARAHDLCALTSQIAWSTHVLQSPVRRRQVVSLRQGSLSCRLSGPVNIEHQPVATLTIPQTALAFWGHTTRQPIREEACSQGLDRDQIECGQKSAERRAMG